MECRDRVICGLAWWALVVTPCVAGEETKPSKKLGEIALVRVSGHSIQYYLSLPSGYQEGKARTWPVLICVAGADSDFKDTVKRFADARGEEPILIVCPCTFSNTNALLGEMLKRYQRHYTEDEIRWAVGSGWFPDVNARLDWDEEGLLAIIADLVKNRAASRVYLTGFSGGGFLTYRMIVKHPDRLAGAVPVCANFNFWNHGYDSQEEAKRADLPVRIITGGKDPQRYYRFGGAFLPAPGVLAILACCAVVAISFVVLKKTKSRRWLTTTAILGTALCGLIWESQWTGNAAQSGAGLRLLRGLGYRNVERETVPDLGHDPAPRLVLTALRQEV